MDLADGWGLPLHIDPVVTVRDDGDNAPLAISASAAGLERLLRLQRERARAAAAALTVGRDADQWMDQGIRGRASAAIGDSGGTGNSGSRNGGSRNGGSEDVALESGAPAPAVTKHCGAGTGGLAIDPYGDVFPCVQWRVPVGNVRESTLHELWTGSPALDTVRRQNEEAHAEVQGRGEWGKALGFCPGAAALETGSPTGIYPSARRRADVTRRLAEELGADAEPSSLEQAGRPEHVARPEPTVATPVPLASGSSTTGPGEPGKLDAGSSSSELSGARSGRGPLLPVIR